VGEPPEAGLPLGLAELVVGARTTYAFPVGPGDQALFYTDGISEARAEAGALPAGPEWWCSSRRPGPDAIVDRLLDDLARHVGPALLNAAAVLLIRTEPGEPRDRTCRAGGTATTADPT
jgi:hypothetical protein